MLFGKKKTVNKQELELQVFKTKVELRRLSDKYQSLLEREVRLAKKEQESGVTRPSNTERIKSILALIATTQTAYDQMDSISTQDELNRTTNELAAALKSVNQIAASTQRTSAANLGMKTMGLGINEGKMLMDQVRQTNAVGAATGDIEGFDAQLQSTLNDILAADAAAQHSAAHSGGTAAGKQETGFSAGSERPMTDEELEAEMDAINRHLYSVLEDI